VNNDDWEDDTVYLMGRTDGKRDERARVAKAMSAARRKADGNVSAALDDLAVELGFKVKTEVSYAA
jgi:hypothetical protein